MILIELPPMKEEHECLLCPPDVSAGWEVVTPEGNIYVCEPHRTFLKHHALVGLEREFGQEQYDIVFGDPEVCEDEGVPYDG